jgi:hypothetical protein
MKKHTAEALFRVVVIAFVVLTAGLGLVMTWRAVDGLAAGEPIELWFFGLPLHEALPRRPIWVMTVCFSALVTAAFAAAAGFLLVQLLVNAWSAEKERLGWVPWIKPYRCRLKECLPVFFWTALCWAVVVACLVGHGASPPAVLAALFIGSGGLFFLSFLGLSHFAR